MSALLPALRMTMCVTAGRIMLNIRGVINEDVQLVALPVNLRDDTSLEKRSSALPSLEIPQLLDIGNFTIDTSECV